MITLIALFSIIICIGSSVAFLMYLSDENAFDVGYFATAVYALLVLIYCFSNR